jgi:hypothetical protein
MWDFAEGDFTLVFFSVKVVGFLLSFLVLNFFYCSLFFYLYWSGQTPRER